MPRPIFMGVTGERSAQEWAEHHQRVVAILVAVGLLCSYPMGVFLVALMPARPKPPAAAPALPPIRGAGVVLSLNDNTGTMAIQHSGVPGLNLPAGSTSFRADPAVLKRTDVGDHINFDLTPVAGVYTITLTRPSPQP